MLFDGEKRHTEKQVSCTAPAEPPFVQMNPAVLCKRLCQCVFWCCFHLGDAPGLLLCFFFFLCLYMCVTNINIIAINVLLRLGGMCEGKQPCLLTDPMAAVMQDKDKANLLQCSCRRSRQGNMELSTTALICVSANVCCLHKL